MYAQSYLKEIGRLAQDLRSSVKGTNTILFIPKHDVPPDRWRNITYGRVVVDYRPRETNPYWTRLTVSGDQINYPRD